VTPTGENSAVRLARLKFIIPAGMVVTVVGAIAMGVWQVRGFAAQQESNFREASWEMRAMRQEMAEVKKQVQYLSNVVAEQAQSIWKLEQSRRR
jgi:hypothetical protein